MKKTNDEIISDVVKAADKQKEWQASVRMDLVLEAMSRAVEAMEEDVKEFVNGRMFKDEGSEIRKLVNKELREIEKYLNQVE